MSRDLFWIPSNGPGRLAIALRPRGGDWLDDEARAWRRAGVDVVVSLLKADEEQQLNLAGERDAAEREWHSIHLFSSRRSGSTELNRSNGVASEKHHERAREREECGRPLPPGNRAIRVDCGRGSNERRKYA